MKRLTLAIVVVVLCGCTYLGREKNVQSIFDNPPDVAPVVSAGENNDSVIIKSEVTHANE